MTNDTILVLADPAEPQLTILANQLAGVKIIAGKSLEVFEQSSVHANVLFNWSGSLALFRKVFGVCPNLQ